MSDFGKFKVHPFADEFPLLEGDEFKSLVESIKMRGLNQPIILAGDNETIVDGRNRYLACDEARVDPRYEVLPRSFTEEQIIAYIWDANGERRQLLYGQRAFLAARMDELLSEDAKKRSLANLKQNSEVVNLRPRSSSPSRSSEVAGKRFGVSARTVQKQKQ
jgi:ParB-like chromosome segregation protein Spo0J